MKKSLILLIISAFSSVCYADAADWTPLLESMKKGCSVDSEALPYGKSDIGRLPAQYRASVARSHSRQTASDGEVLTIELKNSVAFGQPLSALVIETNEGYGYVKMKFARNADVSKLIPLFTTPTDKRHGMLAAGRAQNFCVKGANGTLKQYQSSQHHWRTVSSDGPWQEFRYHPKERALSCLSSDHYGDEVECTR
jgi:hypothetical protein